MRICDVFYYFVLLASLRNVKGAGRGVLLSMTLLKIMVLKICCKFAGEHACQSAISTKLRSHLLHGCMGALL